MTRSTDPIESDDDRLFALVAAYEDALSTGRPLPSADLLSPELFDRFVRTIRLLRRLHTISDQPASRCQIKMPT